MVEIWKSKCRRACSRSVAKVFNPHRNFNTLLLHCFCFIDPETVGELAVYSWWSMVSE
uniref:Uncharacterized protein n=1 Tax=Brassica oleracea TaxID=3712 RepID=A0A3P6FSK6_BRAOL|nr:unnamed protein product [Brassica oleracea]